VRHPSFWHYLAEPVRQQSLWPDCVTAAHLQWALPHGSRACALCLWAPSTPGRLGHGGRFRAGGLLPAGILRAWASVGFPLPGMSFLAAQKSTKAGPGAKVGFGPRISAFSFRSTPSGTKARHLRQPGKDQGFGPGTARPWNGPPKRAKP
jgi:hypothetical protein